VDRVKSPAALLLDLIVLILASAFAAPAAGHEQAPKADAQNQPTKEAVGTIASLDNACSSFVLL
jgi:hypothetical protein